MLPKVACWPTATTCHSTSNTLSEGASHMRMIKPLGAAVVAANILLGAGLVQAAATPEEIARLGNELTCIGAEKAGNADGSITAWTGKWLGTPDHMEAPTPGQHPVDPYPE